MTQPSVVDLDDPLDQEVFFYLVTGDDGVESSLGFASSGAERPNTSACPP